MRNSLHALAAIAMLTPTMAAAEPAAKLVDGVTPPIAAPHHLLSLELLGKGGLWGLGYEYRRRRLSIGGVGSYYMLGGDRYTTLSPYVGIEPVAGEHLAWFFHLGPQVVHRSTPSPGPEWKGMTSTGFAAELSSGVEYQRSRLTLRGYVMASLGAHLAPGIGVGVGWSL